MIIFVKTFAYATFYTKIRLLEFRQELAGKVSQRSNAQNTTQHPRKAGPGGKLISHLFCDAAKRCDDEYMEVRGSFVGVT